MTKKEILKYLQEEAHLIENYKDEDSFGEEYISKTQFKTIEEAIQTLQKTKAEYKNKLAHFKKLLSTKKNINVIKHKDIFLNDKTIYINEPFWFIDCSAVIRGCAFYSKPSSGKHHSVINIL